MKGPKSKTDIYRKRFHEINKELDLLRKPTTTAISSETDEFNGKRKP